MSSLAYVLSHAPFPQVTVRAHVDRPGWFVAEIEVGGHYFSAVAEQPELAVADLSGLFC